MKSSVEQSTEGERRFRHLSLCYSYGWVLRLTTDLQAEDSHLCWWRYRTDSALSCWQIFSKNRLRFIISIQAGSWWELWELASEPMNILNPTCPSQPAIELMAGSKLTVRLPLILLNIIIIIHHSDHPYYVRPCPVSSLGLQNII